MASKDDDYASGVHRWWHLSSLNDAGIVHVSGTTDLPDGARLGYWFVPEGEAGDVRELPIHQLGGNTEVKNRTFSFDADLRGWPAGKVLFGVFFAVGPEYPQPPQVVSRFGSEGEHLAGLQVGADSPGDRNQMFVSTSVQLGE